MKRQTLLLLTSILFLVTCTVCHACNVPVFRFALERWRPDPYSVLYVHQGRLDKQDQDFLAPLQEHQDKSLANLSVQLIDITNLGGDGSIRLPAGDRDRLPRLVVKYPAHLQIESPAWHGVPTADVSARIVDSPARRELVKRLIDGDTAVWLLLESGDATKDEAAFMTLERELSRLEKDLKLPELSDSPDDILLTAAPLRLKFSVLRVSRTDSAEGIFTEMLLHSESDLADRADPLVFPVFGRGRALFPLVGAGITKENIQEAATFLVGPCSCQVKELNPGFDLLLPADWDALLSIEGIEFTAVATEARVAPKGEVELVQIPSGSKPAAQVASSNPEPNQKMHREVRPATGLNTAGIVFVTALSIVGVVFGLLIALRR